MSTQVQYRRGTSSQNDAFTGVLAEITVDTTNQTLRVHDGLTAGGEALCALTATQTLTNKTLTAPAISAAVFSGNSSGTANIALTGELRATTLTDGTLSITTGAITGATTITASGNANVGNVNATGGIFSGGVTVGANLVVSGNLDVNGTITTIDSTTVTIADLMINVANNAATSAAANGGGIGVGPAGSEYAKLTYASTGDKWVSDSPLDVTGALTATGNIDGGNVSGTTGAFTNISGTLTTASQTNITAVGTLTTGTWSATTIATDKGGTGLTSFTSGGAVYATSTSALTTGTLPVTAGGTGATTSTGSGAVVLATSPALTTPNIGAATGTSLNIGTGTVTLGNIVNSNANGVGNIGSSSTYFNTIFATATTALYADLGEKYVSDIAYAPGTVVEIGGEQEITATTAFASTKVIGVISTNPAFIMNSGETNPNALVVALTGRVPVRVIGNISRGDLVCSSDISGVATSMPADRYQVGCVLGKALQNYNSDSEGVIEVLVGRL